MHIGVDDFTLAEAELTVTRGMRFGMQAPRTIDHRHSTTSSDTAAGEPTP
ncbi:hypothetical protein [Pseudonocardia sp. EC080625-04]|nr:hypothetical protein [Pseudonocardia sp. EC080625-04]